MATAAQVIDLSEVRRKRAARMTEASAPMMATTSLYAWVPVWVMVPVWMSLSHGLAR